MSSNFSLIPVDEVPVRGRGRNPLGEDEGWADKIAESVKAGNGQVFVVFTVENSKANYSKANSVASSLRRCGVKAYVRKLPDGLTHVYASAQEEATTV